LINQKILRNGLTYLIHNRILWVDTEINWIVEENTSNWTVTKYEKIPPLIVSKTVDELTVRALHMQSMIHLMRFITLLLGLKGSEMGADLIYIGQRVLSTLRGSGSATAVRRVWSPYTSSSFVPPVMPIISGIPIPKNI